MYKELLEQYNAMLAGDKDAYELVHLWMFMMLPDVLSQIERMSDWMALYCDFVEEGIIEDHGLYLNYCELIKRPMELDLIKG